MFIATERWLRQILSGKKNADFIPAYTEWPHGRFCAHRPNRIIKGVHQDVRSRFRESLMLLEVWGGCLTCIFNPEIYSQTHTHMKGSCKLKKENGKHHLSGMYPENHLHWKRTNWQWIYNSHKFYKTSYSVPKYTWRLKLKIWREIYKKTSSLLQVKQPKK